MNYDFSYRSLDAVFVNKILIQISTYYSGYPTSSHSKNDAAKKTSSEKIADDGANTDEEEFAKEGLRIHNEYRRKHGVPDLKLSKSVR